VKTSDFYYELPAEYIAQTPLEPRDSSRLLVVDRKSQKIEHSIFRSIGDYLFPGDLLVINETRVIPARLFARKIPGGGRVELLLLRRRDFLTWEVLVGGKNLLPGKRLTVEHGPGVEIIQVINGAERVVRFDEPIEPFFELAGNVPLPPYIHTPLTDPERYQTVYSQVHGSAAAPTAGLHFTPGLFNQLTGQGIHISKVVLHVGLDTFAPVTEDDPVEHKIHTEWCQVPGETAEAVRTARKKGRRVIAVGTTSVRSLESAANAAEDSEIIVPITGPTDLYILPGFKFQVVDAMVTNFHLPKSTLLMLVSAFASKDLILAAYDIAIKEGYRFYSFGDAMLIL
jgi:S-adenosylmethionine:tRNA ribosyltransferase-isomerase